jgi:leucyl/phenylalanyl-tRNA--protein transferase
MNDLTLNITILQTAYDQGAFPMAEGSEADSEIFWSRPPERAVLLPDSFHVSRRLARLIRQKPFEIRWNDDFAEVMYQCGQDREEGSWINPEMLAVYTAWHHAGGAFCLSVFQGGSRVGGIYGIQRGGVFMAESMFSRVPNASSVALVVLMAGLVKAGIEMVDVQFENPHSAKFNVTELSNEEYLRELIRLREKPVLLKADYFTFETAISFTQSLTQTS